MPAVGQAGGRADSVSDYISDRLRAQAATLRGSISGPTWVQLQGQAAQAARRAEAITRQAERKAAAEQRQAAAIADWQQVRNRIYDHTRAPATDTLLALLDRHQPYSDEYGWTTDCAYCVEGSYDAGPVEWPCPDYETIKGGMT